MKKIAVIPGDGTGPEVIREALKVLDAVKSRFSISISVDEKPFGAKRYLDEKITLTDAEIAELRTYDAILLGAIGDPAVKPGILEREILLKLRFDLDQYINLRPVKLYDGVETPIKQITSADMDYVVVRENTGGLYTGVGERQDPDTDNEIAIQSMVYSYKQVERCLRYACETAIRRGKRRIWPGLSDKDRQAGKIGQVTVCGKSNVLTYMAELWDRVVADLKPQYPQLVWDYVHVDAVCIYMVEQPSRFDVIVTSNMFGDIITDLAAVTQGGMGVAPGGNLNPEGVSMFEPIGGTAPAFTGLNQINPLAAIGALGLMLDHLGYDEAAVAVDKGIAETAKTMDSMRAGEMGCSTQDVGDRVREVVLS